MEADGKIAYARTVPHAPPREWQSLEAHLLGAARRAAEAAAAFGSGEVARVAGLWHDIGKYAHAFQQRLRDAHGDVAALASEDVEPSSGGPGRVDHSTAGAVLAQRRCGDWTAYAVAAVIAGHHAGLSAAPDLRARIAQKAALLDEALRGGVPPHVLDVALPPEPSVVVGSESSDEAKRRFELWVRMLFSAVVDADRADAAEFLAQAEGRPRRTESPASLASLARRLEEHLSARFSRPATDDVGRYRADVLAACLDAARETPGFFSLCVDTGGGKTFSGLAFALRHAAAHGLRRVVVAIPYTSIIEQSAKRYREALGDDAVLEHHHNVDPSERAPRDVEWETWDAPVVVTTNVQLLESLFADKPRRCRKLHRIARSVIVLDEAQVLPSSLLVPILDVLRELVRNYGCTVVLSTATLPALERRVDAPPAIRRIGIDAARPIVPASVARPAPRVRVEWPADTAAPTNWPELAARIAAHPRVLAIVHRRDDARELTVAVDAQLGDTTTHHLSALMTPAHRHRLLGVIRTDLEAGRGCRVVATQLVEAGVDVDFPVVFRALGGLDSLAQAAGRCNREGRLGPRGGALHVFVAPTEPPAGVLRMGLQATRAMLASGAVAGEENLFSPAVHRRYFDRLYRDAVGDSGVQALRAALDFPGVAERFQMIEPGSTAVVVPDDDEGQCLWERCGRAGLSLADRRAVQRHTVTVYPRHLAALERAGALRESGEPDLRLLAEASQALYDPRFGLVGAGLSVGPDRLMA